ncbi:MAG: hypothetical protein NT155_04155 [Candidatus Staskawiczbacteria bacterium]|nr:hypothetical protein [Candidatus Staskawiczbacteria bacterium]
MTKKKFAGIMPIITTGKLLRFLKIYIQQNFAKEMILMMLGNISKKQGKVEFRLIIV